MQSDKLSAQGKSAMVQKALSLLKDGVIDRVLGWKRGEFVYDVTPGVFHSPEELESEFVYDDFCGANLSKYLIAETKKPGRVLVFLKPCDSYSLNQLLTEHRVAREKVYAVAISCDGMTDADLLAKAAGDGILSVRREDDCLFVETLSDEHRSVERKSVLQERCLCCKKKAMIYDELLSEDAACAAPPCDGSRFEQVEALERMTEDERYAFWQSQLSRCIRCNACRNVCPACSCEKCVFDNPKSGVAQKAAADSFEEKLFHIIRAFHVAGRCTDCGECSRVCPEKIPLHLLNRKFIYDINRFYGDYQAGEQEGSRAPLVSYTPGDVEPGEAVRKIGEKEGQ